MSELLDNLSPRSHASAASCDHPPSPPNWALDFDDLSNPLELAIGGTSQLALAPSPTFTPIPSDDSDTS